MISTYRPRGCMNWLMIDNFSPTFSVTLTELKASLPQGPVQFYIMTYPPPLLSVREIRGVCVWGGGGRAYCKIGLALCSLLQVKVGEKYINNPHDNPEYKYCLFLHSNTRFMFWRKKKLVYCNMAGEKKRV